jgi:hypothetical protein
MGSGGVLIFELNERVLSQQVAKGPLDDER